MTRKKYAAALLIISIAFAFVICGSTEAKIRMSKKNLRITVPQKCTLRLNGARGKVTWKSSNPSVAKVNKNGKVTALRKGKATITAKAGKKKFKCIVVVKESKVKLKVAQDKPTPVPSEPAKTDGPTAVPDNQTPMPELSTKRPGEPTAEPDNPMPTPGDSELCYPTVQLYDAYIDCFVSDIGTDFIEISDADGNMIYKYNQSCQDTAFDDIQVVYDGKVVKCGSEYSRDLEGNNALYSDIRIGDTVDVVYGYYLETSTGRRNFFECIGVNIHKRPELSTKRPGEPTVEPDKPTPTPTPGDSEWCAPCVQDYDVYRDCHVSDIGERFIEISDENGVVIYKFIKFYPDLEVNELNELKVVYDGKVVMYGTETSLKSYEIEGENVVFSDIRIGDTVDVVYGFYLDVPIERRTFECMGINIHRR